MNFSEIFIRRPIATSLLMAALALVGIVAFPLLPVAHHSSGQPSPVKSYTKLTMQPRGYWLDGS